MWTNVPVQGFVMYTIYGQKMDLRNLLTLKQSILTALFLPFKWILMIMVMMVIMMVMRVIMMVMMGALHRMRYMSYRLYPKCLLCQLLKLLLQQVSQSHP